MYVLSIHQIYKTHNPNPHAFQSRRNTLYVLSFGKFKFY